jgi:hypothetical protein
LFILEALDELGSIKPELFNDLRIKKYDKLGVYENHK